MRVPSTFVLLSVIALSTGATGRTFTVKNACPFTIWPALFTDLHVGNAVPNHPTGWVAAPQSSVAFSVPDNWKAGRIWARRDCNFASNPGPNSCLGGGCNGGLLCDPNTGTGVPPATVAEFTLSGASGLDNYDVSLVDGYNLPVRIDNNQGCPVPSCPVDLGPNCPQQLKGPFDSNGFPVGCKSACAAGLSPDPNNSPNCCTEPTTPLKPAHRLASSTTLISNRTAGIPTCMRMMNRAGRHFSLAPRQGRRITLLPSALEPANVLRIGIGTRRSDRGHMMKKSRGK